MGMTEEPKALQLQLAHKVILEDAFDSPPKVIAGMDVSSIRFDPLKMIYAACVTPFEEGVFSLHQTFPYIPGYLSFREAPALIEAFQSLKTKPDVIFVDGQGISHPRALGIASHVGVLLDIPTIGIAKTLLVGKPEKPLSEKAGSEEPLIYKDKVVGMLLRSKKGARPILISQGHRISLKTAVDLVKQELKGYRLPEPIRRAHLASNRFRRSERK